MKKQFLSICLLATLATAAHAQVSFGPEVGGLSSNYTGKSQGQTADTKALFGFRAGGTFDIGMSDNFYLQPSVLYVLNGYKVSNPAISGTVKINTLEIPLNVEYKFGVPGSDRFFIGAGPYIAFNLSGTATATSYGQTGSGIVNIGNDASKDDFKRTDFGLGLNLGYQLSSGLYLRAHYQHGLVNLLPGGDANNTAYNSNYGISIGYLFGAKVAHGHMKKMHMN